MLPEYVNTEQEAAKSVQQSENDDNKLNRQSSLKPVNRSLQEKVTQSLQQIQTKKYLDKKMQALLIEDDVLAQRIGTYYLQSAGFDVKVAGTAEVAVDMVKTVPFDVIVSDIGLPGLSGNEFTVLHRYWEKISNKKPIPIVGLSAHSSSELKKASLAAGMNLVLSKPINQMDLDKIKSLLTSN